MSHRTRRPLLGDRKLRLSSRTPHTQQALLERRTAGDESVLDALLSRCRTKFAHRLKKRFRSLLAEDECEEIVSLAFARAWSHRSDFDSSKGTWDAWVWQIAYHLAAKELRNCWLKERLNETALAPEKLMLLVEPLGFHSGENAPQEVTERLHFVALAMQALPERQRAVLWADACSPNGLAPTGPLAVELGVKPSTIRSLRRRGRARLKAELIRLGFQLRNGRGGGANN